MSTPTSTPVSPSGTPSNEFFTTAFRGMGRPKQQGTHYTSAGGGEVSYDLSFSGLWSSVVSFMRDEHNRPNPDGLIISGPDTHYRPPVWFEYKNVAIDGTPLPDEPLKGTWRERYRKELDIGEAIAVVKSQRVVERKHDVIGAVAWLRRTLGMAPPLDEEFAKSAVEERHRREAEFAALSGDGQQQQNDSGEGVAGTGSGGHKRGVLLDSGGGGARGDGNAVPGVHTAWKALMTTAETGKPLAKVAQAYRPRVEFYSLDPFLDSAPSLIWFSAKCGMAIGLVLGTVKAIQAVNVDVQFLKASGVGVLSILNMSVFASTVKWGGNMTLFAAAFCIGDRLVRAVKRRVLPPADADVRTTGNYVVGLGCSGATVGIMPWWVLSDVRLAGRLAASGFFVGGILGLMVGWTMNRVVSLNLARLDATDRQLRRYEALLLRERAWVAMEKEELQKNAAVWW